MMDAVSIVRSPGRGERSMKYLCALIATQALLAGSAFADTINVPDDYATIQEAVVFAR